MTLQRPHWTGSIALAITAAIILRALTVNHLAEIMTWWPAGLIGIALAAFCFWKSRTWWLAICLPFLAVPLGYMIAFAEMAADCGHNCP